MTELMEQMAELLEAARQQGIADAQAAVEKWRASLADDYDANYYDGIGDAILTIQQM